MNGDHYRVILDRHYAVFADPVGAIEWAAERHRTNPGETVEVIRSSDCGRFCRETILHLHACNLHDDEDDRRVTTALERDWQTSRP